MLLPLLLPLSLCVTQGSWVTSVSPSVTVTRLLCVQPDLWNIISVSWELIGFRCLTLEKSLLFSLFFFFISTVSN